MSDNNSSSSIGVEAFGYRQELKRQGLREIGNDVEGHLKDVEASNPRKPKAKADVIKAYQKVRAGYKPPPGPPLDPDLE